MMRYYVQIKLHAVQNDYLGDWDMEKGPVYLIKNEHF